VDKRKLLAGLVTAALLVPLAGPVQADELAEQKQRLELIKRQMQAQQAAVDRAQRQIDSVTGQLQQIQEELEAATAEYKAIQTQLAVTEQKIAMNKKILAQLEAKLVERNKILSKRLRDIYENGQLSYLDVLLGSTDFSDFTTRLELVKRVLRHDAALIAQIKAERDLVEQKKAELERDRAAILSLKRAVEAKKALIEARKQERAAVLEKALYERETAERAYQELLETSRRIEQMILNAQRRSTAAAGSTGSMIWPYHGPITSEFGWRTHPIFGTARYHSGLDIGADYGDSVVAADGGVVIYADWMGGYGKTVIIDHGGGLTTLYAHNSELVVTVGQRIGKGQLIAYAGSTGYSTGPHVHFEVRVNGAPVNPWDYLP